MPTLRIDNLLDDLRDLLPTDFNLPCDLGDEFADFALGNDGGGEKDGGGDGSKGGEGNNSGNNLEQTEAALDEVVLMFDADN